MKLFFVILSTVAAFSGQVLANVVLPPLISDNLLLQRSKASVWGKADPGEMVTVTLGRASASAVTGSDGRWRIQLTGLEAGMPGDLVIAGKNVLTVRNVAVGDVWVCSGQSNMEMTVKKGPWCGYGSALDAEQEVALASYSKLRMFIVSKIPSETPVEDLPGRWEVCTPENVPHWSAVAYFFGRKLHEDVGVPIGLLQSSWGGTSAQYWTPAETLKSDPVFKVYYDKRQEELANITALKERYEQKTIPAWEAAVQAAKAAGKRPPYKPRPPFGPGEGPAACALYNGMIHGATPFAIKGAIWYQGEANSGQPDLYRRLLPAMIGAWRKAWNQPDLPFYIVQLANFRKPFSVPMDSSWAALRDAQRVTAENDPQSGLAVAIDAGEQNSIHPSNKQAVGQRLALVAEAKTYGKKLVYSGPWFDQAKFEGDMVRISFKPGSAIGLATSDQESIKGFALAGEDKKFVWADVRIIPGEASSGKAGEPALIVTAPGVGKPVAVRYAWANNPAVNLVNESGLPAVPFRTDDWPQNEAANREPATSSTPASAQVGDR